VRLGTQAAAEDDEGRVFCERCIGALQELERAHSEARDKGSSPSGVMRETSVSPCGRSSVVPLLATFSRRYPVIQVELHLDDAQRHGDAGSAQAR
jgi:DNA-binding transcriptional LysR family regulator